MPSIADFLSKDELKNRLVRVVIVGAPSLLLIISQNYLSPADFKSMVTVTAILASFTPLARGGAFHNFKFAVISGEKIAASKIILMFLTAIIASQCFAAVMHLNSDVSSNVNWVWLMYSSLSFVAFVSVAMVEMYFYDYKQSSLSWFIILLMASAIILAFWLAASLPLLWGQFARAISQIFGVIVLSAAIAESLRYRFRKTGGFWDIFRESDFWIGMNIALILSMLGYIARSEVVTGGAESSDMLLANCLLIFGSLKLFLYKEIRALERYYLQSKPLFLIEILSAIILSFVIVAIAEVVTYAFSGVDIRGLSAEWHFRALFSVMSLLFTVLIGSKLLLLLKSKGFIIVPLTAFVIGGFFVVSLFPEWCVWVTLFVYIVAHFGLSRNAVKTL